MQQVQRLTAIIEREDDGFVALCPEVDVASQGSSIEEARANLVEALTLFFEVANEGEISRRMHREVFVTQVEVPVGKLRVLSGGEVCRILEQCGFVSVKAKGKSSHSSKAFHGGNGFRSRATAKPSPSRNTDEYHTAIGVGENAVRNRRLKARPTSGLRTYRRR